jgi:hypothetical protein
VVLLAALDNGFIAASRWPQEIRQQLRAASIKLPGNANSVCPGSHARRNRISP